MATIITKNSSTASSVPLASQLVQGELAVNVTDKRLFTEDSGGSVVELGTNPSSLTLSGGTANGVAYLNGSKVLTSGSALTFNGSSMVLNTSTSSDALRITQTGTGNALLVEDSSNPDSTPFVIDASGKVLIGNTADTAFGDSNAALQITGASFNASSSVQARFSSSDSGGSAYHIFARSKSATLGTNAAVTSGNELGVLEWRGADGTSYVKAASITANVDGTPGTNDMPGRLVFSTTADGASTPTERMRIDSSGNVGIGTSSPSAGLHVKKTGSSGTILAQHPGNTSFGVVILAETISGTDDPAIAFKNYNGGSPVYYGITCTDDGSLSFKSGMNPVGSFGTERARIDSSGNLLVGTTSVPNVATGQTGFSVSATEMVFSSNTNGGNSLSYWRTQSGNSYVSSFWNGNSNVGSIAVTTASTAYNTSSDYRLKENIQPMTGALAKVAALKPVTYKWKADGSDGEGFIAHELAEVVPQCVTGEKDAVDAEGKPVYQGIDTSFLVATLTAAIQELKAEFDAYKASHP